MEEYGYARSKTNKEKMLEVLKKFDYISDTDEFISMEERRIRHIASSRLRSLIYNNSEIEELPAKYMSEFNLLMNPDVEYSTSDWGIYTDKMLENVDSLISKIENEYLNKGHQR